MWITSQIFSVSPGKFKNTDTSEFLKDFGASPILRNCELSMHMFKLTCMFFFMRDSPVKMQTPSHRNLISRSTTAPPPLLSHSGIRLAASFIPTGTSSALLTEILLRFYFNFFLNCVIFKLRDMKLRELGALLLVSETMSHMSSSKLYPVH
jgi:hypothetical protein